MKSLNNDKKENNKRILFYSSVNDLKLFKIQKFYQDDITILENSGHKVILSNKIADALFFWRYDVAYIYFWTWGAFVGLIARLFSKQVVFVSGADDLDRTHNTSKRKFLVRALFFRLCYAVSHRCLACSKSDIANMQKILGQKSSKIVYSPYYVELALYADKVPKQRAPHIVTIAWMGLVGNIKRKGVDKSLYFLKEYIKWVPECKLFIAGAPGEGAAYLKNLAIELEVSEHIEFLGLISEEKKLELLHSNLFYWQVSEYEGFGLAALEALVAGCVVIHSNKGGLAEVIGQYGLQVRFEEGPIAVAKQVYDVYTSVAAQNEILQGVEGHLKQFSLQKRTEQLNAAVLNLPHSSD